MTRPIRTLCCVAVGLALVATVRAGDAIDFDFAASTPVGSWQERELTITEAGGDETVTVMRTSLLGEESRGGSDYVWVEMTNTNYKVKKKGTRKQKGDPVTMKVLLKRSILQGDVTDVFADVTELGTEVIMQTGDSKPMKISGDGNVMQAAMQAAAIKVDYDFDPAGTKSVTVPAGSFDCKAYKGQGRTEAKVVFKTFTVESTSTTCLSEKVPFGVVHTVSEDVINGKRQTSTARLLAYGSSGAESRISGEVQEMPSMPDIFGGG